METTKQLKWGRPTENRYGQLVYTTKCGRFTITKKEFSMPYARVGYMLDGAGVPKFARDNDTISDAKLIAQDIIDGEI